MRRTATLGGMLALLAGCAVGPDYHGPPAPGTAPPSAFKNRWKVAAPADRDFRGEWWRIFRDPVLDRLVVQALLHNQDLRVAVARLDEARALNKVAAADFYPQITGTFDAKRERTSDTLPVQRGQIVGDAGGASPFGGAAAGGAPAVQTSSSGPQVFTTQPLSTTQYHFRAPVDMDWEIDVFGRVRRGYEASRAQRQAAEADLQNVGLSVAASVAMNYYTLRELDTEREIITNTIRSRKEALEIARERLDAGLTNELDVSREQAELASDEAEGASVARSRNQTENALAVLLGMPASQVEIARRPVPIDLSPPAVPAGLPSELLERRPDVAGAERQLAAANAQIGVAVAAFFPSVHLTGAAGFESVDLGELFTWQSHIWQLGPTITLPIFRGGSNYGNLKAAQARYAQAVGTYRGRVLNAFREVENALGDLRHLAAQAAAQARAVEAEARSLDIAREQFNRGRVAFLDVLDAERTLLRDQRTQAQTLGQRLQATVQLIKALGGGWGK